VAKLDQYIITAFHLGKHLVPQAFGDKRPAAAPSPGTIKDINPVGVKVSNESIAPPPPAIGIIVCRRIADDKERRQIRIQRRVRNPVIGRIIRPRLSVSEARCSPLGSEA
jgi:hypothetical protein